VRDATVAARAGLCGGLATCFGATTVMLGSGAATPVSGCDIAGALRLHSNAVDRIAIAEGATKLDDDLMINLRFKMPCDFCKLSPFWKTRSCFRHRPAGTKHAFRLERLPGGFAPAGMRRLFTAHTQRGHRKGQPAGGMGYYRRPDPSATFSPASFPPASRLLQSHQAFLWSEPKNILVSLHSK